jgi:hypothetical protein
VILTNRDGELNNHLQHLLSNVFSPFYAFKLEKTLLGIEDDMETWEIIKTVIYWIIILNVVGAVFTVFREKRDIAATWAWLLVLVLLPVVGFIAYAFIGRKLSHRRLDRINEQTPLRLKESLEAQKREIGMTAAPMNRLTAAVRSMILLFQNIDHAYLTQKIRCKFLMMGTNCSTNY